MAFLFNSLLMFPRVSDFPGPRMKSFGCVRGFHILRLGARVYDLKQEGYEIEEQKVEGKSYSEYRL
jgi:hypothetical protein